MSSLVESNGIDEVKPISITNAAQFRNALENGDANTQVQMLKLIQGIFNPKTKMSIWSSGDSFTQMQSITAIKQMKPTIAGDGTTRDRAFVIHLYNPSKPVLTLQNINDGSSFSFPPGTPFGTLQAPPQITFLTKTWVPEAQQALTLSPAPYKIASRARVNSLRLKITDAGTAASDINYTNGALNATTTSDVRSLESMDSSDMAAKANIDKNVVTNEKLHRGLVAIAGPYIGNMTIANPMLEGGLGKAGEAYNTLTSPVQFNFNGNLLTQAAFWSNQGGTNLTPGQAALPTLGPNAGLMNDLVWISAKTTLSAGSARVRNVKIDNIGFDNYPVINVTCAVPANCASQAALAPTPTPYQSLSGTPFTAHFLHFYMQMTSNATPVYITRSETVPIEVPQWNPVEEVIYLGNCTNAMQTGGIPVGFGTGVGQRRNVSISSRTPVVENFAWIGTVLVCVDSTVIPQGFLGFTAATSSISVWDANQYINVPMVKQDLAPGGPGEAASVAPWWAVEDATAQNLMRPEITKIGVDVPRLYDEGNLEATLITVSNVTDKQTYNVELHAQLELTAQGDVSVFSKVGADVTITDISAVQLLQMAFDTPGNSLKLNYALPEYIEIEQQVLSAETFADLLKIEAFRTKKFMQAATSAGLFGSLGSMLGGLIGGQQGQNIGGMIGHVGDQAMEFAPMLATGMFGAGDDDDEDVPSAKAAFGLKLRNGLRVGPPHTLSGQNPGLAPGMLVSHEVIKRMITTLSPVMTMMFNNPGYLAAINIPNFVTPPQIVRNAVPNRQWVEEYYDPQQLLQWLEFVYRVYAGLIDGNVAQGQGQLGYDEALKVAGAIGAAPQQWPAWPAPYAPQGGGPQINVPTCTVVNTARAMQAYIAALANAGYVVKPRSVGRLERGFTADPNNQAGLLADEFQKWFQNDEFTQSQANKYVYYGFVGIRVQYNQAGLPANMFSFFNQDPYAGTPFDAKYGSQGVSNGEYGPPTWCPLPFDDQEYSDWQDRRTAAARAAWQGRARPAARPGRFVGGYGATGMFGDSAGSYPMFGASGSLPQTRRIESSQVRRSQTMGI